MFKKRSVDKNIKLPSMQGDNQLVGGDNTSLYTSTTTLDSFNAFTVTVTPQSILWKYSME